MKSLLLSQMHEMTDSLSYSLSISMLTRVTVSNDSYFSRHRCLVFSVDLSAPMFICNHILLEYLLCFMFTVSKLLVTFGHFQFSNTIIKHHEQ